MATVEPIEGHTYRQALLRRFIVLIPGGGRAASDFRTSSVLGHWCGHTLPGLVMPHLHHCRCGVHCHVLSASLPPLFGCVPVLLNRGFLWLYTALEAFTGLPQSGTRAWEIAIYKGIRNPC